VLVTSTVETFLAHHGLWAIFVLMAIDAIFPAASELVMLYAGALASGALAHKLGVFGTTRSGLDAYVAVSLAGTFGYLFGALIGWAIGIYGGKPFLAKHGRWVHLNEARMVRAERWFERWDDWAVFVGRITPVARSFISIPAGVFRAPLVRYTLLTLLGSAIWAFAFAGVGYALGTRWETFHHDFRYVEYAVVLGIVAVAVYLVVRWRRSVTMARRATDSAR
jgi:membrane protein DedA with SNARE-associated domain